MTGKTQLRRRDGAIEDWTFVCDHHDPENPGRKTALFERQGAILAAARVDGAWVEVEGLPGARPHAA